MDDGAMKFDVFKLELLKLVVLEDLGSVGCVSPRRDRSVSGTPGAEGADDWREVDVAYVVGGARRRD